MSHELIIELRVLFSDLVHKLLADYADQLSQGLPTYMIFVLFFFLLEAFIDVVYHRVPIEIPNRE